MDYLLKYAIITQEICKQIDPGKKMLQKLMYLMERKGVDLRLNYSIHFYGPYSSKLDTAMHMLEGQDMIEIDTSQMTHVIHTGKNIIEGSLPSEEKEKVEFILSNFATKTALELEAITTLDYAASSLLNGKFTEQDVIEKVREIKGGKFSKEYLQSEFKVLEEYKFV